MTIQDEIIWLKNNGADQTLIEEYIKTCEEIDNGISLKDFDKKFEDYLNKTYDNCLVKQQEFYNSKECDIKILEMLKNAGF